MAKYLVLWKVDPSRAPVDPKERGAAWGGLAKMVKQDLKNGDISDWGCFTAEANRGYTVSSLSDLDLSKNLQKYYPWVTFEVYQVMSIDQIGQLAESLTK